MSKTFVLKGAALLVALAGTAIAQPTIDGSLAGDEGLYGSALWVQTVPTQFGDNLPGTFGSTGGPPESVTTGLELVIPLTEIGLATNGPIKLAGFINGSGHDFISNQVIGGLAGDTPNIGEPRRADFNDIAGNQFITFTAAELGAGQAAPVLDGTRDAIYGAPLAGWLQNNFTGFGDAVQGDMFDANGSEINAVYGVVKDGNLYLFIAGNVEDNFNKMELFFDTVAGGQNTLRGDNPDVDFNGLNRMGALFIVDENDPDCVIDPLSPDCDRTPDPLNPGLTFDTGFEADYWIAYTGGGNPYEAFYNWAELLTNGGGAGGYLGRNFGMGEALVDGGITSGINGAIDNSNIGGVGGLTFSTPSPDYAVGSEINGLYGFIDTDSNTLHLLVTGNLETNGNSLDLFFDVTSGGQNSLRLNNVQIGQGGNDPAGEGLGGLNRMGEATISIPDPNDPDCAVDPEDPACDFIVESLPGLTFDTAFSPDYYISVNNTSGGGTVETFTEAATLRTNGKLIYLDSNFNEAVVDYGAFFGGNKAANNPMDFSGPRLDQPPVNDLNANLFTNFAPRSLAAQFLAADDVTIMPVGAPGLIRVSINNSNVAGVTDTDASGASSVTTGIEVAIDLDELGWDGVSEIKVAGFLNAGDQNFVSNQVIGSLPEDMGNPAGNLGEPRAVDFSMVAGEQFVVIPVGGTGGCGPADTTTTGTSNGIPDGVVDISDYSFYLTLWGAGNLAADVTTTGTSNGIPDGVVDISDFSFYLTLWGAGCP